MSSVPRVQGVEVEGVRVEVVDEGAESYSVVPTRAEVLDFYSLTLIFSRGPSAEVK